MRLSDQILENMYSEERTKRIKFFDKSKLKIGQQPIANRLKQVFDDTPSEITFRESNNRLRLLLKKSFGFPTYPNDLPLPLGSVSNEISIWDVCPF